jgi:hypothetical protein
MTTLDPPSIQETIAQPEKTLDWISERLMVIYSFASLPIPRDRHINQRTYNGVWTYLQAFPRGRLRSSHVIANERGRELYALLKSHIQECCQQYLAIAIDEPSDTDPMMIVRGYVALWKLYSSNSEQVNRIFKPLDDRWVRRELDEAASSARPRQEPVYLIPELHRVIWRETMLSEYKLVLDAIRTVRTRALDPRADVEEERVLEECMASLNVLGLTLFEDDIVASVS